MCYMDVLLKLCSVVVLLLSQMNVQNDAIQPDSMEQETRINDTQTAESSEQRGENQRGCEEEEEREICEEDVGNFIKNEDQNSKGQNDYTINKDQIPETGMHFETREKAQNFFNMYAFAAGFSTDIVSTGRTTSRKRNREVIRVTMKWNKYGNKTPQEGEQVPVQRQTTVIDRTKCKMEMVIAEKNGVWRITNLSLDHNHALRPQSRFFSSHIYMTDDEKAMIRST